MDPLSITASVITVLQLSAKVLSYLADVKCASKDRETCELEISNLYSLLIKLRSRLEEGSSGESWYTAVRALGIEHGPLDQFKQALEQLQAKITGKGKSQKIRDALIWKFSKEEVRNILDRIERLKTLVNIALQQDSWLVSNQQNVKTIT
jgi:hypothetical protein